jgi:hypothetical protein
LLSAINKFQYEYKNIRTREVDIGGISKNCSSGAADAGGNSIKINVSGVTNNAHRIQEALTATYARGHHIYKIYAFVILTEVEKYHATFPTHGPCMGETSFFKLRVCQY